MPTWFRNYFDVPLRLAAGFMGCVLLLILPLIWAAVHNRTEVVMAGCLSGFVALLVIQFPGGIRLVRREQKAWQQEENKAADERAQHIDRLLREINPHVLQVLTEALNKPRAIMKLTVGDQIWLYRRGLIESGEYEPQTMLYYPEPSLLCLDVLAMSGSNSQA